MPQDYVSKALDTHLARQIRCIIQYMSNERSLRERMAVASIEALLVRGDRPDNLSLRLIFRPIDLGLVVRLIC